MLVANSSSREEWLLQGCHRVPPQILKKRKRNLRKDSACQRTEVKGAVPINGIGMSQAPRSRTAKPRGSSCAWEFAPACWSAAVLISFPKLFNSEGRAL